MKTNNAFFTRVIIAAVICCAVSNVMAQEVTPPTANNPADIEYSATFEGAKYNYADVVTRQEPYRDKVETYIGNDTEPTVLWSRRVWSVFLGLGGAYRHFDGDNSFGVSAEVGYMWKWIGGSLRYTCSTGYQDRTSMSQTKFNQDDFVGTLYIPLIHLMNHHILIGPFGAYGKKFCRDYQKNDGVYKDVVHDDENRQTIITTTTALDDLDNRASTKHWYAGVFVAGKLWGSRLGVKAEAGWGRGQQLTFVRDMWHNQIVANISVTYTFFDGGSFNDAALKKLGLSRKQVKKNVWF